MRVFEGVFFFLWIATIGALILEIGFRGPPELSIWDAAEWTQRDNDPNYKLLLAQYKRRWWRFWVVTAGGIIIHVLLKLLK